MQRRLYSYILTLLPSLVDADDVLQESNAVFLRKRNEYVPDTDFGAWACRVAYFEVLTHRRRLRRERGRILFADEALLDDLSGEAAQRYARDESIPVARLEHCMDKLSPLHRELMRLRYRTNQSSEQIAATTGRSASAVRQLLYRIRTRLLQATTGVDAAPKVKQSSDIPPKYRRYKSSGLTLTVKQGDNPFDIEMKP